MARTADQIQADIDAVRAQFAVPAREIRFGDRSIVNRDVGQMETALAALLNELDSVNQATAGTQRVRQIRMSGNSGFGSGFTG